MVASVLMRGGEASMNYWSLAILLMFLSFLVVSLFVVCTNSPFQAKLSFLFKREGEQGRFFFLHLNTNLVNIFGWSTRAGRVGGES
jgi:hypothetical protein